MERPLHSREPLVEDYCFSLVEEGTLRTLKHELKHSSPGHMKRVLGPLQKDLEDTAEALLGRCPARGVVSGRGSWERGMGLWRRGRGELNVGQACSLN